MVDKYNFIEYNDFTKTVKLGDMMKQGMQNQIKGIHDKQLLQMAINKLKQVLSDIPFVSELEVVQTGLQRGFGDFYLIVHFTDDRTPLKIAVEVGANGEKRFVDRFLLMASQYKDDVCYLFMAPYISENSAEIIKKKKCSYMDLSGNCYILSKNLVIHFSGNQNQHKRLEQKRDYFSKSASAASAVMRMMLEKPYAKWHVKKLSELTERAIGTVSNVKKYLLDRAWIEDSDQGFALCNIKEMLYSWAKGYHRKPSRTVEYYSFDSIPTIEAKIAQFNSCNEDKAVLAGFSAAARYAPTVRYKKVQVYVEYNELDLFAQQMSLQQVSSGGNVVVIIPHDETPCMFTRSINGDIVTSPAQTVIDLLGENARGEEAADAVILKEFKEGEIDD